MSRTRSVALGWLKVAFTGCLSDLCGWSAGVPGRLKMPFAAEAWCEGRDLNPHTEVPDPKSGASTSFATFAREGKDRNGDGGRGSAGTGKTRKIRGLTLPLPCGSFPGGRGRGRDVGASGCSVLEP